MNKLLEALERKLVGEVEVAKANIEIYVTNPVGIGEHPDLVAAVESQVDKYVHALEMVEGCNTILGEED